MSCATWYEGTAWLLSLNRIYFSFFYWLKEWRKLEYPEKMSHTNFKAQIFKFQSTLKPALKHWWQARTADVLTITPRVTPQEEMDRKEEPRVKLLSFEGGSITEFQFHLTDTGTGICLFSEQHVEQCTRGSQTSLLGDPEQHAA